MKTVIVRYAEIALKSQPVRRRFEGLLLENIRGALKGTQYTIRRERGRIFVDTRKPGSVCKVLSNIPGIVSVSPALRVPADLDTITSEAVKMAKKFIHSGDTFAVRTSREGSHPFVSREVNERVGREVLSVVKGARVNLSSPRRKLSIEVRGRDAYIFKEVVKGVGGLPAGSQGEVLVVFSGSKKDSAAAFLMLKRGCLTKLLFLNGSGNFGKVKRAAEKLLKNHPRLDLLKVPFQDVQKSIGGVHPPLKSYLHRRVVMRVAELVADIARAEAIVLGDDAKVLAAQGLAGLELTDRACDKLVLRPLLGVEMKNLAPKSRRRKSGPLPSEKELKEMERKMVLGEMIQRAVKQMETIRLELKR